MDKKDKELEAILYKSLRLNGYIVPVTEEDVDIFEENMDDIIVPDNLPDSITILSQGYSTSHIVTKGDNVYSRNMAYAARNGDGDNLPENIKEQMKRDKERAKKDI